MTKRALAIKEEGCEFFLHEARGGQAVGDPVGGPFASQIEAEGARFEAMKKAARPAASRAPLRHSSPAHARTRVK